MAIVMVLLYGAACHIDNKRRASEIAEGAGEEDWLDLSDKQNKAFKYTT